MAHTHFKHYPAVARLHQLASHAIDLSLPGNMTPARLAQYSATACGYRLLYGTERVTPEVMQALHALAEESGALEKMTQMQRGDVMNYVTGCPSEMRAVLHTATRDLFDHPQESSQAREAATAAKQELEKLRAFWEKEEHAKSNRDTLIVIGIGGSELGPRAHYTALQPFVSSGRAVHFISNVDPDEATAILHLIDPQRTWVLSISKSGTTLETETNEARLRAHWQQAKLNPQEAFLAITMPGTPMDDKQRYHEVFYLWDWVGGRFSTTSMVGGVILSFAFGIDLFWEFLRGAHDMDRAALHPALSHNLPLLEALLGIWNRNFLNHATFAVIPYSRALSDYPAHLQQVDMESNGKSVGQDSQAVSWQTGPILWGATGTNAQHSFFQLLHQGTTIVPLLFIGFKSSQWKEDIELAGTSSQQKLLANLFAQSLALVVGTASSHRNQQCMGNRPNHILLGEQLTPYHLGALLSFYEHKVAFQGFIWGINSFDQEGVQLGKKMAHQFLTHFQDEEEGKRDSLVSAYLSHL